MTSVMIHNKELTEIIDAFYQKVKHPYLNKYIKDPYVDEDQVAILYLMLKNKFDPEYTKQYIIITLLVQAALDTHERISSSRVSDDTMKKKRQLTVLAGDYYSSLYYYFLAKLNDVSLMRVLAKSIQEINESKMNVYKYNETQQKASFADFRLIDSSLVQNIATLLHMPEWKKAADEFFFFKRLLKERFMWKHTGVKGSLIDLMLREHGAETKPYNDNNLLQGFDRLIDASKDKLLAFSREWTSIGAFFNKRVHELLIENRYDQQCVMEEG
ncbi:heptaprenyl diphosphate synthase [Evansella caseinilytica]|uniref:Heptaprenyl diphosphate synthase n=1 Tax=Evansella caseinilytica TaxID=1503961 RepID=A0A1H3ND94_9BACI|nr:heptaprenyl diphosphate synthase component 1 [Evansella caseinilytica]SDY86838.1 heptaprenyl diphosphate synthase [Evansella caseinilytica]